MMKTVEEIKQDRKFWEIKHAFVNHLKVNFPKQFELAVCRDKAVASLFDYVIETVCINEYLKG